MERGLVKEKYKRRYRVFPELERFENDRERKQILKQCSRKTMLNWKRICVFVAAIALLVLAVTVLRVQIRGMINLPTWVSSGLIGGFVGGLIGGTFQWYLRNSMRKYLREQLIARGVPICLHCGYDLRGQTEPRCPECGKAFDGQLLPESHA